jgi:hypothetical protein
VPTAPQLFDSCVIVTDPAQRRTIHTGSILQNYAWDTWFVSIDPRPECVQVLGRTSLVFRSGNTDAVSRMFIDRVNAYYFMISCDVDTPSCKQDQFARGTFLLSS